VGGWLRRWALRALERDDSPEAVELLAAAAGADDGPLARAALAALERRAAAGCGEAREALCRLVLERDHGGARGLALAGGYAPREAAARALFLFLTEQWDAYDRLDFDRALLRAGYRGAGDELRLRVAEVARRAGRIEWVEVVSDGLRDRAAAPLCDAEWRATLEGLAGSGRWAELWRLAQQAPPRWAARLLGRLHAAGWAPEGEPGFARLVGLALRWEDPGLGSALRGRTVAHVQGQYITCLAVSPDGMLLVGGAANGALSLWRLPEGQLVSRLGRCLGAVTHLKLSPDGRWLAAIGKADRGGVQVWDLVERRIVRQMNWPSYLVNTAGFWLPTPVSAGVPETVSPWLLGCTRWEVMHPPVTTEGTNWPRFRDQLQAWDPRSGQLIRSFKVGDAPSHVALSPDGRWLVSVLSPARACVHEWPGGKGLASWPLSNHPIRGLLVGPDGQLFVWQDSYRNIDRWALPQGRPLPSMTGHREAVRALALAPDGKVLASVDSRGAVRLWGLPEGRPLQELHTEPASGCDLRVTADGLALALIGRGGSASLASLRLWT
jgi:WD40 repeat protein